MKSYLKQSKFAVAAVRSAKALAADAKILAWSARRQSVIKAYGTSTNCRRLHLGASHSVLPGWLNTDVWPEGDGVIYLDATRTFPFDDHTFDYIFSEHMIEHVDHQGATSMLRECHRVLKPGGKIRIATPDLAVLIGLHGKDKTPEQQRYVQWIVDRCLPGVTECQDVFVINNAFRAWGHAFLYDRDTLTATLSRQGFENLRVYKPGISDDPQLQGLESHGKEIQDEAINQFETLVIEGERKSGTKS